MVSRVFNAQRKNPYKGDWVELVEKDLEDFNITETFEEISNMKKEIFKKKVSQACKKITLKYLLREKERHKKGYHLNYQRLEIRDYLVSDKFTTAESKLLFKLRTEMLEVKSNFKGKYKKKNQTEDQYLCCQLCKSHIDTQENLLLCTQLNENNKYNILYSNFFSPDINTVAYTVKQFKKLWRVREEKLSEE